MTLSTFSSLFGPVTPSSGCLICNGLINAAKLQEESVSNEERDAQRYVDDPDVIAPSVVTLNAVAASHAANDFLFNITGLRDPSAPTAYQRFQPLQRIACFDATRKSSHCLECGTGDKSRFARGDNQRLPTKE